jgi:SAM-dependent methyltransferase
MGDGPFDEVRRREAVARLSLGGPRAMPDFLHRLGLEEMAARLSATRRHFGRALLCTVAPRDAKALLAGAGNVADVLLAAPWARPRGGPHAVVIDPARPGLAAGAFDLVAMVMEPAVINDLPGAFVNWRRLLRPGGLLLAAFPGGESLKELRGAWALADEAAEGAARPGRVAPFCDIRQVGTLLQLAGFVMPVVDVERLRLRYADALSLMMEIRAMGLSARILAGRPARPVSRGRLAHAAAALEAACAEEDGRISVTLEMLHVAAWVPEGEGGGEGSVCGLAGSGT